MKWFKLTITSIFDRLSKFLNSNIGYVFINLSHSLDGKPLLGASSDLVSVRRGPGDCLGFVLPPAQLELGQHSPTL